MQVSVSSVDVAPSEFSLPSGFIVSVSGGTATAVVPPGAESPEIGALVRIGTGRAAVFGLVASLSMPQPSAPPGPHDLRTFAMDLFGEIRDTPSGGRFERGVSAHPRLGAEVRSASEAELALIFAPPAGAHVRIGSLRQDPTLPVHLIVDKLLGGHFAVLGTTGSGKSCTTALILHSLLDAHPHGHVLVLDPHDEYARAFGDKAEIVSPSDLRLPYWMMDLAETEAVLCPPSDTRSAETAILKEALLSARQEWADEQGLGDVTVDTPSPYRLHRLIKGIEEGMGRLDKPEGVAPYRRLLARIDALRRDERYAFMFTGLAVRDELPAILGRLLRIPADGRPVCVLTLAGLPAEIIDVVVSLLFRLVFDLALWMPSGASQPVLLVCEEAHRYAPRRPEDGFRPARAAIERIAKEGRKYGVSLCLVSQRPSEVSETILSQCNTLFALRMTNQRDQTYVAAALPEGAAGLIEALPALRTQEAVVVGEGVRLPMRIRFDDLPGGRRPQSDSARFSEAWRSAAPGERILADAVGAWRRQRRSPAGGSYEPASNIMRFS